jgi:hypothetical protein
MALQSAQSVGPTCSGERHIRQALGESPARAGLIEAAKAPRLQLQRHRPALPRQSSEQAAVAAMDAGGESGAGGT